MYQTRPTVLVLILYNPRKIVHHATTSVSSSTEAYLQVRNCTITRVGTHNFKFSIFQILYIFENSALVALINSRLVGSATSYYPR